MSVSFFCTFVCLSALLLKSSEASKDGCVEGNDIAKLPPVFSSYLFTKEESKLYFTNTKDKDQSDIPGYLRVGNDAVSEIEEGKRTAVIISQVIQNLDDDFNLEITLPNKDGGSIRPIVIFASHGLKGSAAILFAIDQQNANPSRKIVIFLPNHIVPTSGVSDAFEKLKDSEGFKTLAKYNDLEAFKKLLFKNPDFANPLIIEALFGIGFRAELGINPESYPVIDFFFELAGNTNNKVINIDIPAFYNTDAGTTIPKANNEVGQEIGDKTWPLFSEVPVKQFTHEMLDELLRKGKIQETYTVEGETKNTKEVLMALNAKATKEKFEGKDYTPYAVIFIGFLKPCYTGLLGLVQHVYLGGHFLPQEAVEKLIGLKSVKDRYKDINFEDFPTYTQNKLFYKLK